MLQTEMMTISIYSSPFIHEKEHLFFYVPHRGINYLRNDFRAINRGALCVRKNGLSAPRCVDIGARITGATNGYTERTTTRQLTAQPDEQ